MGNISVIEMFVFFAEIGESSQVNHREAKAVALFPNHFIVILHGEAGFIFGIPRFLGGFHHIGGLMTEEGSHPNDFYFGVYRT